MPVEYGVVITTRFFSQVQQRRLPAASRSKELGRPPKRAVSHETGKLPAKRRPCRQLRTEFPVAPRSLEYVIVMNPIRGPGSKLLRTIRGRSLWYATCSEFHTIGMDQAMTPHTNNKLGAPYPQAQAALRDAIGFVEVLIRNVAHNHRRRAAIAPGFELKLERSQGRSTTSDRNRRARWIPRSIHPGLGQPTGGISTARGDASGR